MKKFILTFPLLVLISFCVAQQKENMEYSIKLLPQSINDPQYKNYNASMNDLKTKICFVRESLATGFPEIVISTRNANGEWSEPIKIYPTKNTKVEWRNEFEKPKKGVLLYPDYEAAFSEGAFFVNYDEVRNGKSQITVTIRKCKINGAGNMILFEIESRTKTYNLCSLTLGVDQKWQLRQESRGDGEIIDFSGDGEFFVSKGPVLYRRDKLGKFQFERSLELIFLKSIASDNITWLDNHGDFVRYFDFSGRTRYQLHPFEESTSSLDFKEGEITWFSKDLQVGLFNTEKGIGELKIQQPIYFQESNAVRQGWIKPWRDAQPVTSIRNNSVKPDDKPKIVKPTGKYYALVIGISNYDDPSVTSLARPTQDAQKFRDILVSKYEFSAKETTLLVDATREQIIGEFNRLRKIITPNDNLLIFYAGHGKWDEAVKQGYWLPRNANWNNEANWISNSDIKEQIRAIQSGHTLLISDACFSGGIFRSRNTESIRTANYDIVALYKMPSRRAMTSGTMSTVPDNSVFFDYLTKRLSENEEKFLPSTTLFDSFRRAVINNTMMVVPQDGIIAETGDEGGDFIFIKKD